MAQVPAYATPRAPRAGYGFGQASFGRRAATPPGFKLGGPKPLVRAKAPPKATAAGAAASPYGYGTASDLAQANALADQLLGPQTSGAQTTYQTNLQRGLQGIRNLTQGIIGMISPFEGRVAGMYSDLEGRQRDITGALRDAAVAGGQTLSAALSAKLGAINAPAAAIGQLAGQQAQEGQGAGAAAFGIGSAELSRLLANEGADRAYILKQPGILGGLGIQEAGRFTTAQTDALNQSLARLATERASITQSALANISNSRAAAAKAADTATYRQQRLDQQAGIAADRSAQGWARIQQSAQNASRVRTLTDKQTGVVYQVTPKGLVPFGQISPQPRSQAKGRAIKTIVNRSTGDVYEVAPGGKLQRIGNIGPGSTKPPPDYSQTGQRSFPQGSPVDVISKWAPRFGLDPVAVLAYALTQGGTSWGAIGDTGTSFGPFQAHIGGAAGPRTPQAASAWANSPQGLIEMMGMMSRAGARGMTGPDAAAYIVGPAFGRGANPARDQANARARYHDAYVMLHGQKPAKAKASKSKPAGLK